MDLRLKRTYDTEDGQLLGYYDNDVASNDDLLVKYLAKNKDAVLGDIIATIQKEQNRDHRDRPYKNIIVQGWRAAARPRWPMHRISYILYNYEDLSTPASSASSEATTCSSATSPADFGVRRVECAPHADGRHVRLSVGQTVEKVLEGDGTGERGGAKEPAGVCERAGSFTWRS